MQILRARMCVLLMNGTFFQKNSHIRDDLIIMYFSLIFTERFGMVIVD
jgi:hypothetical protein